MSQSDEELLGLFQQKNKKEYAFGLLVKKYQQRLYWHIRRMLIDHDDTDDVLQNTFIKAWKGLDKFRSDSKLYTWLYRIATNETITFLNQKKSRGTTSFDDLSYGIGEESIEGPYYSGDEIQQKLYRAIDTLPEKQKLVFNMRYFD
ncbi:MAG: RNA polymerase subunit sigma, partial [Marinilabiliales bacterium]